MASPRNSAAMESPTEAATRGAELTQRLLSFARQQPLTPQVIDLAELIVGMEDMLVEYPMGAQSTLSRGLEDLRIQRFRI